MKKFLKWLVVVILFGFVVLSMAAYYIAPIVKIDKPEKNDDIIKLGDGFYVMPKKTYDKGDVVLVKAYDFNNKDFYQATRMIVGLPGETIANDDIPEDAGKVPGIYLVSFSVKDGQYAVRTSMQNKSLSPTFQEIVPATGIYGVVIGGSVNGVKGRWDYFVNRTKFLPSFPKWRMSLEK